LYEGEKTEDDEEEAEEERGWSRTLFPLPPPARITESFDFEGLTETTTRCAVSFLLLDCMEGRYYIYNTLLCVTLDPPV